MALSLNGACNNGEREDSGRLEIIARVPTMRYYIPSCRDSLEIIYSRKERLADCKEGGRELAIDASKKMSKEEEEKGKEEEREKEGF